MNKALGSEFIHSFELKNIRQISATILNALIERILHQDIHPDGFDKIVIDGMKIGTFEPKVLMKLTQNSTNISNLTIKNCKELSIISRVQLVESMFSNKVYSSGAPKIVHLDFSGLCKFFDEIQKLF